MFKKMPIRLRLTALMVILLTICCVGLTVILNFSAGIMATKIDAVALSPAQNTVENRDNFENVQTPSIDPMMTTPSIESQQARTEFQFESVIYLLLIIVSGGVLTYYVSGKVLKPLDTLNRQINNRSVHNLAETMEIPPTNDEIAELTQSFNEMTDKLNDAFLMQSRFTANAAHELRTPLAVLKTKVDVFKKKTFHSTDEYDALITIFEKQIQRLSELVIALLEMTNMNDGFEKEPICLKDVLQEMIAELAPIADEKKVRLYLECDNTVIYGNPNLLYRAFYNLVENGIKYNVDGGNVMIHVKSNDRQIMVAIKDTGIEIPDELKNTIFEPFYRVDTSRSRETGGVGLGLSIVQSIVTKHRGTIKVSNNEDGGTCFELTFSKTN
ncbi:two-component sensor histidine kinase [Solibacillus sp. R5-41]|uniref:sensor histidine kinase n=1 Tax=Solibacillus sp. R5-41 TaxID=2048654 RepID=UPI000C125E43|nr:HAMP domain-containing sensor histidine kinase [Solibacillus sp. R5-41]ATP40629.1 two-component sensor histidine kinase [Solibacillus sp. R5-41]